MKKIALIEAAKLTSPNPVTLICSLKPNGTTNLATVSWWTYLSLEPETIGFAMMKTSYTGEMVRSNKKVVLTIPGSEIARQVMECGTSSGRYKDKAREFGIDLKDTPNCEIKIPTDSVVAIQCKLRDYVDVGDHYLYICDVENVYGDADQKALFAWKGYAKIAPAQ